MIKGIVRLFLLVVLVVSLSPAQRPAVAIEPAVIHTGTLIDLTYDASGSGAVLAKDANIHAELLLVSGDRVPELVPVPMKRSGPTWKGTTAITDSSIVLFQVRFVGSVIDDNNGDTWYRLVVDASGNPLRGANTALGNMRMYGSVPGFTVKRDPAGAVAAAKLDADRYLEDWRLHAVYWSLLLRARPTDDTRALIDRELHLFWRKNSSNEEAAADLVWWFDRIGKKEEGDSLRSNILKSMPKGLLAKRVLRNQIEQERDPSKRAEAIVSFQKAFRAKPSEEAMIQEQLAVAYLNAKRFGDAIRTADSVHVSDLYLTMMLNDASWTLAESGTSLDTADLLAERAIAMARNRNPADKPKYQSQEDWERGWVRNLGLVLDTYGYVLGLQHRDAGAKKAFAEAVELLERKEVEVNERYAGSLLVNDDPKTCLAHCSACIRMGQTSEQLVASYRTAYVKVKGSEKGFAELLERDRAGGKSAVEEAALAGMLNEAAKRFALRDLEGKLVKLADLKGKVVIVDFWATWCGPCKASFPFLQQVYEKYKGNKNVQILALNTWERVAGSAREEAVKKLLLENKYTFRVLYDDSTVTNYGVDGIPTKFVIDKTGTIRFKSIGFDNGPKMVTELSSEIDLLLKDSFYRSHK